MNYVIKATKSFYGPSTKSSIVMGSDGAVLQFEDKSDAEEAILLLEDAPYYTAHNECGAPEYKAVKVSTLSAALKATAGL